jgi:hypothetical protein
MAAFAMLHRPVDSEALKQLRSTWPLVNQIFTSSIQRGNMSIRRPESVNSPSPQFAAKINSSSH